MPQAIIFDMDGTLFQTNTILELSLQHTFDRLRSLHLWQGETPIGKYREIMGVPLPVVWEQLLPEHSDEIRQQANGVFHEKLIENIMADNGALYPHAEDVLSHLADSGCTVFIASNGQAEYLQAIVSHYRLDRWVAETCSIEQMESGNKSDLVRFIMQKYQIEEGAVVGDRLSDINAAKDNGLLAVGCDFDFAQATELAQADIIIGDLIELKAIIGVGASQTGQGREYEGWRWEKR